MRKIRLSVYLTIVLAGFLLQPAQLRADCDVQDFYITVEGNCTYTTYYARCDAQPVTCDAVWCEDENGVYYSVSCGNGHWV